MTTRILTPSSGPYGFPIPVFDRTYTPTGPGVIFDVPDQDANILGANRWLILGLVGTTAQRPSSKDTTPRQPYAGQEYIDTTLGYLIIHDGASWRNPATGAAV